MAYRYILFGYKMIKGELIPEPVEAKIVVDIFTMYINGKSLKTVTDIMNSTNFAYSETSNRWNRSIISRMLENKKYTRIGGFPQIISTDLFNQVQELKENRRNNKVTSPIIPIKEFLFCNDCGKKLKRKQPTIKCEGCGFKVNEFILLDQIMAKLEVMKTMKLNSSSILVKLEDNEVIKKLEQTIDEELQQPNKDMEKVIDSIFQCVSLRFEESEQADNSGLTEYIKKRLADTTELSLIQDIADKILAHRNGVQFKLKNEMII